MRKTGANEEGENEGEALKAVMEKSVGDHHESASANIKRQRTNIISMS